MIRRSVAFGARLLLLLLCLGQVGGLPARAQDQHQPAFEKNLPPDARELIVRPYSTTFFARDRGGYLWRMDYGWRDWEAPERVLRAEIRTHRFPTPEAAQAFCHRMAATAGSVSSATRTVLTVPDRLKGYDCTEALLSASTMTIRNGGTAKNTAWNERMHVFSRGPYVIAVLEDAISGDIDRQGPPPAFLAKPPIDDIADRLDRLTRPAAPAPRADRPKPRDPAAGKTPPAWTPEEQATARALAASAASLGLMALATLLLRIRAGLPRQPALANLLNMLRGRLPDPYVAWKQKYTALGWRYVEEGGVGRFVPPAPRDGQVDPATGKVWYADANDWVSREYYAQEVARTGRYAAGQAAERAAAEAAARAGAQAWSAETGAMAHDIASQRAAIQDAYRLKGQVAGILDKLEARERAAGDLDENRELLLGRMRERLNDLAASTDPVAAVADLKRLGRLAVTQGQPGYEPTYTHRDAMIDLALDSGAVISDALLTRGAASAGLAAYRGSTHALEGGASGAAAVWSGLKSGLENYAIGQGSGYILGEVARTQPVAQMIEKGNAIDISLFGRAAETEAATGTRIWGTGMKAVQDEATRRGLQRLPPNSSAYETGLINEALSKAGPRYNARRVKPDSRLDPGEAIYRDGVKALTRDPRLLTPQAKIAADAVRNDLRYAASEDALESLYAKNPELRNGIKSFKNTGSHANKPANYNGLDSDIDFTPQSNGTAEGERAVWQFQGEFEKAFERVTREAGQPVSLTQAKIHAYGGPHDIGAFHSEGGLKVKDMMNQTSGTIDKVSGTKITHTLNGGDPVEIGEGARWTTGDPTLDSRQLEAFRRDCVNKFHEEAPEMTSPAQELRQASKLYKLARSVETKNWDGRSLDPSDPMLALARSTPATLSPAEQAAATQALLEALEKGL